MRLTIAKLRLWIVGLAVLLLAVLAGFFLYARHKAYRSIFDLPKKLDGKIERSSDGFTYSQSVKGRTSFSIHASNAIQYKGGTSATLHDVVITLYGAQGDRSDRISGSEFDYDQKSGIVTAKGEVQIDLQGAGLTSSSTPGSQDAATKGPSPDSAQQIVHIKTSGLVFNQQTQVATTTQYVEFNNAKGGGHSTGATYEVQKGLLVLNSAVELNSDRNGKPVVVHASHVEFLRSSMQAFLLNPVSLYEAEQTSSDQAIVYFRPDGTAEHIDAQGHIHVKTDDGREMTASNAKVLLDQKGQPQRIDAGGGLNFTSNTPPHQMHGNAVEGTMLFAAGGALSHAQARNAVSFVDQQTGLSDDPQGSATRELRASQVDVDFTPDANGHAVADKILAGGGATTVLHTIRTKSPSQNTTIKGDQLLATLLNGRSITSLHGAGHTSVLDVSPNGATDLSNGDTLQVSFNPSHGSNRVAAAPKQAPGKPPAAGADLDTTQVQSVIQEGNVVIVQTPAAPNGGHPAAPTRITAQRADYSASTQILRLTGSPRIDDGTTDLIADSVDYHRDTSIADVSGNVKATYRQAPNNPQPNAKPGLAMATAAPPGFGGQGATHVISTTATLDQARGQGTFRGQARLWQGANSVTAPVIELSRNPQTLKAIGEAAGSVTTVIASASDPQSKSSVFRVQSRQLLYSDADRKALFTGAVAAEGASGMVHCDQAEVFLAAPGQGVKAATPGEAGSSRIERIVATGHVVLQQPGRRGVGEKLLYTAQDEKYVLTGTSATPPRLYDQIHGTVSGEALIFNNRDDSVSVSGGPSKAITDTRTAK